MATTDPTARRVLVTGGARGIGLAIARRFAHDGAAVALADIDEAAAQAAAADLGGAALAVECDVRSTSDVQRAVDAVVAELGGLDVLVNNAGIEIAKPIAEHSEEEFQRTLDVNVLGTFRCTKAAIPALAASEAGAIVNLASVTGTAGAPLVSAYCASKGAVIRFTESCAIELRAAGIRVNAVCPGMVATEMADRLAAPIERLLDGMSFDELIAVKQGRFGTPEEVAETVAFLASDEAAFITGAHYMVDGGLTASLL